MILLVGCGNQDADLFRDAVSYRYSRCHPRAIKQSMQALQRNPERRLRCAVSTYIRQCQAARGKAMAPWHLALKITA